MPQISARVSEDLNIEIEAFSNETNTAKSEAIRTLLRRGIEYDDMQTETTRLRQQLAAANQRIDASNDLVEYVEDELSYREAGLGTRMKSRAKCDPTTAKISASASGRRCRISGSWPSTSTRTNVRKSLRPTRARTIRT